jgi:hypothetical protein
MPTSTYVGIANITLGTAVSSVTFSSISQTYKDLVLIVNGSKAATSYQNIQVNADTGSNYAQVKMYGFFNGVGSGADNTVTNWRFGYVESNQQFALRYNFLDFSATDKHKSGLGLFTEVESGLAIVGHHGRWANNSAITSIKVTSESGNYNTGTSFSLFGVAS